MVRNRIKLITVLLITMILCIFYHNITFRLLLITLIVLPIVSLIQVRMILKYTELKINIQKKMIGKERKTDVIISVTNKSQFPISEYNVGIKIYNEFYEKEEQYYINVPITRNSIQDVRFEISSELCGNVCVEIYEIEYYDMLRLKKYKRNISMKSTTMILPSIEKIQIDMDKVSNSLGEDIISSMLGEDPFEIVDIRDYIPGDRLQRIHWKLSIKQEQYMVKEYAVSYESELNLVIELFNDEENILDKIIDIVYTLIHAFVQKNEKIFIGWFNSKINSFYRVNIENEENILEVMKEIYLSKLSDGQLNSYVAYCDERGDRALKALYLTKESVSDKIDGEIVEKLKDDIVLMCI